ncbi:MAG: M15 family metallopeptidase [Oscillospiraceae bacterium]|nr:M15 family metallopeptidase [Oscillospiraceae bacterium]
MNRKRNAKRTPGICNRAVLSAVLAAVLLLFSGCAGLADKQSADALPDGFIYVTDAVPDIILEIRYYSTYNFVGARVDDYLAPVAIISESAAAALKQANDDVRAQGYAIKVFDAYRPQGAVDHFVRWAADENDVLTKEYFYPDIEKDRIIPDKYIMERSGHSRGSTIDLTLIDMLTGKELDMGSPFDFFGLASHHGTGLITQEQANNRLILKNAMEKAGFLPYDEEWWHYTLADEPYPDIYFTFPIK